MNNQSNPAVLTIPDPCAAHVPNLSLLDQKEYPNTPNSPFRCIPSMINTVILQKVLLPKSVEMSRESEKQNQYLECNVMLKVTSASTHAVILETPKAWTISSLRWSAEESQNSDDRAKLGNRGMKPPAPTCRDHRLYLGTSLSNHKTKHIPKKKRVK
ncbi:hypothetical protein BDV12DRAFT_10265 [Aspergillus spectabilis]